MASHVCSGADEPCLDSGKTGGKVTQRDRRADRWVEGGKAMEGFEGKAKTLCWLLEKLGGIQ